MWFLCPHECFHATVNVNSTTKQTNIYHPRQLLALFWARRQGKRWNFLDDEEFEELLLYQINIR